MQPQADACIIEYMRNGIIAWRPDRIAIRRRGESHSGLFSALWGAAVGLPMGRYQFQVLVGVGLTECFRVTLFGAGIGRMFQ